MQPVTSLTKRAIRASFLKLLNERPLNKITVKDIVEDCGINRNSFYYHYPDIPALAEEIVRDEAARIVQEYPTVDSLEQCLEIAVEFALQNRTAVLHLYNSASHEAYEHSLMDICHSVVGSYFETAFAGKGSAGGGPGGPRAVLPVRVLWPDRAMDEPGHAGGHRGAVPAAVPPAAGHDGGNGRPML